MFTQQYLLELEAECDIYQ